METDEKGIKRGVEGGRPGGEEVGAVSSEQFEVSGGMGFRNRDASDRRTALAHAQDAEAGWHRHIGFLGIPGYGKSYSLGEIVAARRRAVMFDPANQYGRGERKNPLPGFVRVTSPGELKNELRARLGASFRILYQPPREIAPFTRERIKRREVPLAQQHFEALLSLVLAAAQSGDVTLGVDEIANYCSASWMPENLDLICREGRHRKVSLAWSAQRAADVTRGLTFASRLWIYRQEEPADLAALRERGAPIEIIQRLPKREFVAKNTTGEWETFR